MTCPSCKFENRPDASFCAKCGTKLEPTQETVYPEIREHQRPGHPSAGPRYVPAGKNAFLAVMLSFVPGCGQLYNNDWKKAFTLWAGFFVVIVLAGSVVGTPFAVLLGLMLYIWSIVDAYRVAKHEKALW